MSKPTGKKFWGPYEIVSEVSSTDGNGVIVSFAEIEDAAGKMYTRPCEYIPLSVYNDVITSTQSDLDTLRKARLEPIVAKVLEEFLERNVFIGAGNGINSDVEYVFRRVSDSLYGYRNEASLHFLGRPEHLLSMRLLHEKYQEVLRDREEGKGNFDYK